MAPDREQLAQLYERVKGDLVTVALHLVGERAAAEDLVHDVFVAFARRGRELASLDETRRYLVTSCVHRSRELKRRRLVVIGPEVGLDRTAPRAAEPLRQVGADDDADQVRAALRELPDEQREVVTLHLHGGLAFREIGETLEISINTVTSRYRYALEKLRARLAAKGVGP